MARRALHKGYIRGHGPQANGLPFLALAVVVDKVVGPLRESRVKFKGSLQMSTPGRGLALIQKA